LITLEKITYHQWLNCYRYANDQLELIITTDIGPRIIRLAFLEQENEFYEDPTLMGQSGGDSWKIYGGHRLWHAPEAFPRTYAPDNSPITLTEQAGFVRVSQPPEASTGIQKEIDLQLHPQNAQVTVTHRLYNHNLWAVEVAPWALSVLNKGGQAILPLPPRGSHAGNLTPTSSLALWSYTDMSDSRWTWGQAYILLRQDPTITTPQKIGSSGQMGWVAYARNNHLFVKEFTFASDATYPDLGSAIELFTNTDILEVETLAPLSYLQPGDMVEYVEQWYLFDEVPQPQNEAEVVTHVLPKVNEILQTG